jgi:hypothetical protein
VIDVLLIHGEELHAAKSQLVRGVDLMPQRGVGVEAVGQPPPHLRAVLDRGMSWRTADVIDRVMV